MAELVWIHRTNANELGISQTPDGTGRGSFFLVPVEARQIFFPYRDFHANPDISEQINLHFIDENETVTVNYSKPNSKTEHRLSLSGLSRFIGNNETISPNKILCFYRKNDVIHFTTVTEDSVYGNLLNTFPNRGKSNNLVTNTIFDNKENNERNFNYSQEIIKLPKPFLLLAGVSGTGKSRFVREQVPEEDRKERYQLVAVRPDWHDPSDLLGYVSRLSGQAQYVMTDVLKFIVKAWKAIAKADLLHNNEVSGLKERLEQVPPYWLCLDEMNLAPVEQYFADYLAVIESRKWVWNDNEFSYQTEALLSPTAWEDVANFKEQLDVDDDLWDFFQTNGIGIPFNLIVAGTVNMDETTHAFSRKVLDRALSFDFSEFYPNDFDAFFEPKTQPKRLSYPIYSQVTQNDFDGLEFAEKSIEFLTTLNIQFENTPFKLGYRALNELLLSVKSFQPQTIEELQAVWDDFVMLKVLPRIEGDENKLYSATQEGLSVLEDIETVLKKYLSEIWQDGDFVRIDFWQTEAKGDVLKTKCRTKPKLANMKAQLINRGIVSFW